MAERSGQYRLVSWKPLKVRWLPWSGFSAAALSDHFRVQWRVVLYFVKQCIGKLSFLVLLCVIRDS